MKMTVQLAFAEAAVSLRSACDISRACSPKCAKALAKLGVRTPADVARWTPEDVEKAASALGIPATRIQKAGWIEQAQELEKKA